jgi:tRNA threonylcarbamoyl adenosine modification protein (Sua5/YciO/YrdC/YwlC family)
VRLVVHPDNPQSRSITRAVEALRDGQLMVYPTDSGYAFGWALGQKAVDDRVRQLRQLDRKHPFTLICRDLRQVALYARMDDSAFRLIRSRTPGPYTFILPASRELPRRLMDDKRRAIGVRIAESRIVDALLDALDEPFLSSSLSLPNADFVGMEVDEIHDLVGDRVDVFIDGGPVPSEPSTVIDLVGESPRVLRMGRGKVEFQ